MFMLYLCGIVMLAGGMAGCVHGIRLVRHAGEFSRSARKAAGSVTGFRERMSRTSDTSPSVSSALDGLGHSGGRSRPITLYYPIVRFETHDGRVIETETMYGASYRSVQVGEPVIVLFDPTDPTYAALEKHRGRGRLFGILTIAMGLFISGAGILALAFARFVNALLDASQP